MRRYELSFQKNIRDLGGLETFDGRKIKYGRIYRGGALGKVNKEDIKVVYSFGLTDIIDFRGVDEFLARPDYKFLGVNYHSFPVIEEKVREDNKDDGNLLWFVDNGVSGFEHLRLSYREFVTTKKAIRAYRHFFRILLEEGRSVYFHCSQGKDRAGFAAYLVEIALGVPVDTALADYLSTNIAMEKKIDGLLAQVEGKEFCSEQYKQDLRDVFAAKLEYISESINLMNELYGSSMNFIEKILGVDVERLRTLYLE